MAVAVVTVLLIALVAFAVMSALPRVQNEPVRVRSSNRSRMIHRRR
jgi:hypothetical protein